MYYCNVTNKKRNNGNTSIRETASRYFCTTLPYCRTLYIANLETCLVAQFSCIRIPIEPNYSRVTDGPLGISGVVSVEYGSESFVGYTSRDNSNPFKCHNHLLEKLGADKNAIKTLKECTRTYWFILALIRCCMQHLDFYTNNVYACGHRVKSYPDCKGIWFSQTSDSSLGATFLPERSALTSIDRGRFVSHDVHLTS